MGDCWEPSEAAAVHGFEEIDEALLPLHGIGFFYNPLSGMKQNGSADLGVFVKICGNYFFVVVAVVLFITVIIKDQGLQNIT